MVAAQHHLNLFVEADAANVEFIAAESHGPCLFILDNASYHKRLTSEKDTLGYWNKLPAIDVKEARS